MSHANALPNKHDPNSKLHRGPSQLSTPCRPVDHAAHKRPIQPPSLALAWHRICAAELHHLMVVLAFTVQSTSVQTPPSAKKITDQITATQDHTCHLMLVDLNMQCRKKAQGKAREAKQATEAQKRVCRICMFPFACADFAHAKNFACAKPYPNIHPNTHTYFRPKILHGQKHTLT